MWISICAYRALWNKLGVDPPLITWQILRNTWQYFYPRNNNLPRSLQTNSLSYPWHHTHTCCPAAAPCAVVPQWAGGWKKSYSEKSVWPTVRKLRNAAGCPLYTCWPLKVCELFIGGKRSLRRANQLKGNTNMLFDHLSHVEKLGEVCNKNVL